MKNRRQFLKESSALGAASFLAPSIYAGTAAGASELEVGVLFSLSGGLAMIEKSLSDATLMAIEEINAAGGVNGMMIKPILEDGASDPKTYNEKASKLVIRDRVPTVFGSYTSASRKAVLPVFEKRNNMYFYPTYYEGYECSKNVVYTGAVPNQQPPPRYREKPSQGSNTQSMLSFQIRLAHLCLYELQTFVTHRLLEVLDLYRSFGRPHRNIYNCVNGSFFAGSHQARSPSTNTSKV